MDNGNGLEDTDIENLQDSELKDAMIEQTADEKWCCALLFYAKPEVYNAIRSALETKGVKVFYKKRVLRKKMKVLVIDDKQENFDF